ASVSGPATKRSCMPRPVLPSLITMIGCSAASGAFERDFNRPRHSARKPPTELAPPTSTANSVRLTASGAGAVVGAGSAVVTFFSAAGLDAPTSGVGAGTGADAVDAGSGGGDDAGVAAAFADGSGSV